MLSKCKRALKLLVAAIILFVISEVNHGAVTPVANPGPFHYHSGQPDDVDPAIWTSSSAYAGTTTAFSLWGSLTGSGVPGEYAWSTGYAIDGADYEETIVGAQSPQFEWQLNLKVDIEVWVDPHIVDNDTTYWTNAESNARLRFWHDGVLQGWSPDDPKEVERVQEDPSMVKGTSRIDLTGLKHTTTLKIEYRVWAWVNLRTDRAENLIHGKAATDHGSPGAGVGWVKKRDGQTQIGPTVELQ